MKNKKIWNRIAATFLAGCMVMGCLVGCGSTENKESKESEVKASASESAASESVKESEIVEQEDPAELTYYGELLSGSASLTNLADMEIMQIADEKCNTKVTYVNPAVGTETESFSLRLATGEFEDIVEHSWSSYSGGPGQAIEDGVIIDLAPYLEQGYAPNYKKLLDEKPDIAKQVTTDDGKIFAFACIGDASVNVTQGYFVRQDFLDACGLEAPTTIAEWETMLSKFKNELGVEAPLTIITDNLIGANAHLAGAFGVYSGYYLRDGKVHYGFVEESYKDYIETMARWYKDGLIDQNVFGNDSKAVNANLLNDKSAVSLGYIGGGIGTLTKNAQANENANPNFKLSGLQFPVLNEGDEPEFMKRSWDARTQNMAAISTSCEDIEAAMRYLDFWYSDEGHMLKNFGVEDLSYKLVDGEPIYTDLIMNNPDGLDISDALGRYTRAASPSVGIIDRRYYEQYYQLEEQVEAMYTWNEYADNALKVLMPSVSQTPDEAEEISVLESSFSTYIQEELTKFILGNRDMSEYDDFIKTVKGMGVDRAIELKQAAYDRYLAR